MLGLLLRTLLPSWRFFDEIETAPLLSFRTGPPHGPLGDWRRPRPPPARRLRSLLVAPQGNLHLAYHTLLERLVGDLSELEDRAASGSADDARAQRLISYQLVCHRVCAELAREGEAAPGRRYQFKLTEGETDIVISAIHVL